MINPPIPSIKPVPVINLLSASTVIINVSIDQIRTRNITIIILAVPAGSAPVVIVDLKETPIVRAVPVGAAFSVGSVAGLVGDEADPFGDGAFGEALFVGEFVG